MKKVKFNTVVPVETHDWFMAYCKNHGIFKSWAINMAIVDWLEGLDKNGLFKKNIANV